MNPRYIAHWRLRTVAMSCAKPWRYHLSVISSEQRHDGGGMLCSRDGRS